MNHGEIRNENSEPGFYSLIRSKVIYIFKYMFLNHVQVIYNTCKCFVLFSNTVKKISYNKKCYLFFKLLNPFCRFLFEAFYLLENLANFFVNPFFPFSYILLMNFVEQAVLILRDRPSMK